MKEVKFLVAAGLMIFSFQFASAQQGMGRGQRMEGERPSPEKIFQKMDANDDGRISKSEFKDAPAPPRGPRGNGGSQANRPNRDEVFTRLDADGNGYITLEEFKDGARKRKDKVKEKGKEKRKGKEKQLEQKRKVKKEEMEKRNSVREEGIERRQEFAREKMNLTWKNAKTMLKAADVNKDKQVSFQEFADETGDKRGSERMFAKLDSDNNGYLTKKEVKKALK